ncbi:MAG: S9 family peptidase [Anaerolineae bacterium]
MLKEKRWMTAEDLYAIEQVTYAELSPDGARVVYARQWVDRETEKKYANLWVVAAGGGAPRRFTVGKHVDGLPRWSPDGKQIAFISNRDDEKQSQLYLIPVDGGEAQPLTELQGEIGTFEWSPQGDRLVIQFRADEPAGEEHEDEDLGMIYRHFERVFYALDGRGYLPKARWHLHIVDAAGGETEPLTEGDVFDEVDPTWSPDGEWIAFCSNRSEDPDLDPDAVDLFVIPAAGGEARRVPTPVGQKQLPAFSPDGTRLAYVGREGRGDWWKNQGLWVVPVDGSEAARPLTAGAEFNVAAITLNDVGGSKLMPPTWSPDGRTLYVQTSYHGSTLLQAVDVSTGAVRPLVGAGGVVGVHNFDAARERVAYVRGTLREPPQVWIQELRTGETRRLTHLNAWLDEVELGEIEEVWFKGAADNDLQGWILKPPDFDPEGHYPSILEIHGGPWAQYGHLFMHEFYYLAAQGYVVYFCNPRGSSGYGEAHARAIWGKWGDADYADLMAWADYVAAQPYIDVTRMGVTGGSYGGYMTSWIVGHTDRFRAAVTQRSVNNLISMWGSSDMNWVFQKPFGDSPPYAEITNLWDCSPLKYAGHVTTPTLVIHSEQDLRCPLEQGQQFFVALRTQGVETEFVVFPEEPHGLSRQGRTDRRIARLDWIRRWFERYLREEGAEERSKR